MMNTPDLSRLRCPRSRKSNEHKAQALGWLAVYAMRPMGQVIPRHITHIARDAAHYAILHLASAR